MIQPSPVVSTLLFLFATGLAVDADAQPNLLANGDFETLTDGKPADWPMPAGATLETEGANHFLRLHPTSPNQTINVYRDVPVAGVSALQLSYKVRYSEVKRGTQAWFDARIIFDFKDAAGAVVKPGPGHPFFTGSSAGWVEKTIRFNVPSGATVFSMMPAMFQVESGTLDVDDLKLVAINAADVPAK